MPVANEWMLFVGAAVRRLPGLAGRGMSASARSSAALVTFSSLLTLKTWWECSLIPLRVLPIFAAALFTLGCFSRPALLVGTAFLGVRLSGYALDLPLQRLPLPCIVYWGLRIVLYSAALVVSARKYSAGSVVRNGPAYTVRP
jgi:hypothetical protein